MRKIFGKFKSVKGLKFIGLLFAVILIIPSCANKENSTDEKVNERETVENLKKDDKTDFDAIIKDMIIEYSDSEKYPMIEDFTISLYDEDLTINIIVSDSVDKVEAKNLATEVLKSFATSSSNYNSRYIKPSENTLGSVFKEIETNIGIAQESKSESKKDWLYNKVISFTDDIKALD